MRDKIKNKCRNCGRRIGWIELGVSFALACFKLFIGVIAGSHALIGASFYSIQDMISAGIIIFSTSYSDKNIDEDHPYGYGKIEFIASICLSAGVIVGAFLLFLAAGKSILAGPRHSPSFMAFWAAVIVFAANEVLYRYSMCAGDTLNSPAIKANAAHTRADSISAACVAMGIVVSKIGFSHIDPIIAIFEVVHVSWIAVIILNKGFKGLMDTSLPDNELRIIKKIIKGNDGVKDIVNLRSRELGQCAQVDVEISLDPDLTIADVEPVIERTKEELCEIMPRLREINISAVPYRPGLAEEKVKASKVREILSDYYRQFIEKHNVKIVDNGINLVISILPNIALKRAHKVCNNIKSRIEEEIPDTKIFVEIDTKNN